MKAIIESTPRMPYGMRFMARETLAALRVWQFYLHQYKRLTALQEKFPDEAEDIYAAAVGKLIYYRFINPAIVYVMPQTCIATFIN